MIPDALIVFSAATVPYETDGNVYWRTTTYADRDAFGALGGRDRVEAAAVLAQKYPEAYIVTTSRRITGESMTLARVYADEIAALGVERGRIIEETVSVNAKTQVEESIRLALERGWKNILMVTSEYQLPRVIAFYERMKNGVQAEFVSSESVLLASRPEFAALFEAIRHTGPYQERIVAEARGVAALKAGVYKESVPEEKRERPA